MRRYRKSNAANAVKITIPIEMKYVLETEAKDEWSNEGMFTIGDLSKSTMWARMKEQYEQYKINSISVTFNPALTDASPARIKFWTIAGSNNNDYAGLIDAAEEKLGFTVGARFRNNPQAKQTVHIPGQKTQHRVYIKPRNQMERYTYHNTSLFTYTEEVKTLDDSTTIRIPNQQTMGTNPLGFNPSIRMACQHLTPNANEATQTTIFASYRITLSFKNFKYWGNNIQDSADATTIDT